MRQAILTLLLVFSLNGANGQCWSFVKAGLNHSMAIRSDGTLWTWGRNNYGQLGDGTTTNRKVPVQVGTDANWAMVAAGIFTTVAIKTDGTMWAWGECGTGLSGNGNSIETHVPVQVGTASDWIAIFITYGHALAIKNDGTLCGWGNNNAKKLGLGPSAPSVISVPTQIGTDTQWQLAIAGHSHSIALKNDGTVWAWGQETNGSFNSGTLEETREYMFPPLSMTKRIGQ